jgi:hypothetical protein
MDNLNDKLSNEAQNQPSCLGAVIGSAFRSALIDIGFQELPHFTITNNLIYDLGRNRHLSFGSIETQNEMLFICETEEYNPQKIEGLIVLKNYDYDGYTSIEQVKALITLITGRVF